MAFESTNSPLQTTAPAGAAHTAAENKPVVGTPPHSPLLFCQTIQPKLIVGAPDDPYEKEADAVAEKVMRMPERHFVEHKTAGSGPHNLQRNTNEEEESLQLKRTEGDNHIQKKCADCEKDEKKIQRKTLGDSITPFLQTKSGKSATVNNEVSNSIESSRGGGTTLDPTTRSFMSSRFGNDFSSVKIHTDSQAVQLSGELNAKAFTVGRDVFFNQGQYQPNSSSGKRLLTHELTHVVQQGAAPSPPQTIQKQEQQNSLLEEEQHNKPIPEDEAESIPAISETIESSAEVSRINLSNGEIPFENSTANSSLADASPNIERIEGKSRFHENEAGNISLSNRTDTENSMNHREGETGIPPQSTAGASASNIASLEVIGTERLFSSMNQEAAETSATSSGGNSSAVGFGNVMTPYTDLVEWVELKKLSILQHTEGLKLEVLQDAELEKQAIVSLINSQVIRFKTGIQGAIDSVNLGRDNARIDIKSEKENNIKEVNEVADIQIGDLEDLVSAKQDALTGIGEGIAGLITEHGENEANRATTQSEANSGQINSIIRQISAEFSDREGASDLESEMRSRSANMSQEFMQAGNNMAGQVRQDVQQMAIAIRGEATEASSQFNDPLVEARNAINRKRELTIFDLETIGNNFLSTLNTEADEIIHELRSQELQQEPSIRQIGEAAFGSIDEAAAQTNINLDIAGQQIVGELQQFIVQLEEVGWHPQEMADAQTDIQTALQEHNQEVQQYLTEVTLKLSEHYSGIEQESNVLLGEIEAILSALQTDFQTGLESSISKIMSSMDTITSDSISEMETVVPNLEPGLDRAIQQSEEDWKSQLLDSEADISGKVNDGLDLQHAALSDFSSSLRSEFGDLPSKDRSFLESAWDVASSIGEFVAGIVVGLFEGLWELLKGIWAIITTPASWLLTIVVVIAAVIVVAIVAVLLGVEFAVAAIIVGVVLGLMFAAYYIYQAITAEGLSPYDRGRLVGRGIFEGIMAFAGTGLIARLAKWSTRIGELVNIVNRVGGLTRFLPILTKVDDIERLISVIARLDDGVALARLIERAHDANTLLRLLDSASDASRIVVFLDRMQDINLILSKVDDVAILVRIIDKVSDVAQFERVLSKVDDAKKLINLVTSVDDASRLLALFEEVSDINRVLAKVDDAQTLLKLVGKTDNVAQLEQLLLLDKIADSGQLERLLGLGKVDDIIQLERLLDLVDDGARLERLLLITDNGLQLEGYAIKAGGAKNVADLEDLMNRAVALGDFRRIEDLLNIANGNVSKFNELAIALKNFDVSIAPSGNLSNLHGYTGANLRHFQTRHTYEYFDFGEIKASNTLWPKGTDVAALVDEALTILDNIVPPRRLLPFEKPPVTITLSNNVVAQIGLNNADIIGQFFPFENRTRGVINFVRQEMSAFKKLLIP